jgi:hypothetical protein
MDLRILVAFTHMATELAWLSLNSDLQHLFNQLERFGAPSLQLVHLARTTHTAVPFPPSLQALDANAGGINAR